MIDRNSPPDLSVAEAAIYWCGFLGEHYSRLPWFNRLRVHVERSILARGLPEPGIVPVPRIDPAKISPSRFREEYIKRYAPVVLTGAGAHVPAIQKWSPEFFKSRYGDEKICVRAKSSDVGVGGLFTREVTLAELVDNITSGGEYYAANLEDVFNAHPELRDDLMLPDIEAYTCARQPEARSSSRSKSWRIKAWGEILSTQIFMSNDRGRTGYHCASGGNLFLQAYGRKRWRFVNPRHTPFMYPVVRKDFFYSASPVDANMTGPERRAAGYPLYELIPVYEAVLEPGDLLYSPQWWWHTVDNFGSSIGVAMRFRTGMLAGNPVYSIMTALSPNLLRHLWGIARTGWGTDATGAKTLFEPEGQAANVRVAQRTGGAPSLPAVASKQPRPPAAG